MKSRILISILFVLLILLAVNTYKQQNKMNKEHEKAEQQTKTIDSLLLIIEARHAEERYMREKTLQIIANTQKQADSIERVNRKN